MELLLLIHALILLVVKLNHRWNLGMDELVRLIFFHMDVITYPCPNPDAGLAHLR